MSQLQLTGHDNLLVKQAYEIAEFVGFETRNKYQVLDERQMPVAYAAEQQKGFFGFILRQFLGHWRSFEITIFDPDRQPVMIARHPFRIFFQRLEIFDVRNQFMGAVQQRWAIFRKRFDVEDPQGAIIMEVSSPFFSFWTFPFMRGGRQIACVQKKWGGLFTEFLTDKDSFLVQMDPGLAETERRLVLAASIFIDLQYFEVKGGGGGLLDLVD